MTSKPQPTESATLPTEFRKSIITLGPRTSGHPAPDEEENTKNEATAGARNAMLTNYVNKFAEFDSRVPVSPTAIDPTNPLDIAGPIKSGGDDLGSFDPGGTASTSGGPTTPSPDQPDHALHRLDRPHNPTPARSRGRPLVAARAVSEPPPLLHLPRTHSLSAVHQTSQLLRR